MGSSISASLPYYSFALNESITCPSPLCPWLDRGVVAGMPYCMLPSREEPSGSFVRPVCLRCEFAISRPDVCCPSPNTPKTRLCESLLLLYLEKGLLRSAVGSERVSL